MRLRLFIGVFIFLLFQQHSKLAAQQVTIDAATEYQSIRGFGGMNYVIWGIELDEEMRKLAFSNNPGEMGLSILRIPVPPDKASFNRELATASYAKEQGAIIFASPWNPPSSMIEARNSNDNRLLPQFYDAYIDHLNSYVSYMAENNIPLFAISIQNEPDWHGWTTWSSNEMLNFVKQKASDINCKVIAPESFSFSRSMTDPLLNDAEANANFDILGTHLYGTPRQNYYYPLAIQKNKEIWMTEHLLGSEDAEPDSWELAMELADEINTCMDANFSAFVYWYIHRFYGLINDAGVLTNKGYVMSQFSKFIRPGAKRVEANFKPVAGVNVTAFKEDSVFVIAVVNHNNKTVDLNFNISNLFDGIDSLSQFTTTVSKRVVNEGVHVLSDGSFTATVAASSVTTFTSDPSNGARADNKMPVALAGDDVEILDTLGIAYDIKLQGSSSFDEDGEIVKFLWSKDGELISNNPDLELDLNIGDYQYILTVIDNEGAVSTDTINITIYNLNSEEFWFEAECANYSDNWLRKYSTEASNIKYLTVDPAKESKNTPSGNPEDILAFDLYLLEGGSYNIWARVRAPNADDDSFWIKIDDGEWYNWNGIGGGDTWVWDFVGNASTPNAYVLDTGYHTLYVGYRESGADLDKLYVTNTGQLPAELGGDAFNCQKNNAVSTISDKQVLIYPNPVQSVLNIESDNEFNSIQVLDLAGRLVYNKELLAPESRLSVELKLSEGIYFLKLLSNEQVINAKFVVE